MGILNVTPDSFSDGGRFAETDAALERARQMVARRRSNLIVEAAREGYELVLAPKAQGEA